MTVRERSGRWAPWLGVGLAGLAIAEMLTAAVLSVVVGWSWRDALEAFVVTRCEVKVSPWVTGPAHRTENPIICPLEAPGYPR